MPGLRKERDTGRAVCARQGRTGGRRTGLIERLLNAANKQSEKTKAEGREPRSKRPHRRNSRLQQLRSSGAFFLVKSGTCTEFWWSIGGTQRAPRMLASDANTLRTSDWEMPNCRAISAGLTPAFSAARTALICPRVNEIVVTSTCCR